MVTERKIIRGMSQATTTAGGFLVPPQYYDELLKIEGYDSVAFPDRVRIWPCAGRVAYVPVLDQTGTPSNGSSSFYGNVTISTETEGVSPVDTAPTYKQLAMSVVKEIMTTEVSNELLLRMSPISVQSQIESDYKGAMSDWCDLNVFQGSSAGSTPWAGIIDNAATISVKRVAADKVSLQDLANMWAKLAPKSRKNACWFINPAVWGLIPWGKDFSPSHFVTQLPNIEGGFDLRIFGLPILDTQALPKLGDAGDVVLADLSKYAVALNREVTIDASAHVHFTQDTTMYRSTFLAMGKPQLTAPIILQDGITTVSPFVQLDSSTES